MSADSTTPTSEDAIAQILTRLAVMEEKIARLSSEVAVEAKLDRLSAMMVIGGAKNIESDAGDPNAIRLTPKQAMARLGGISRTTLNRAIVSGLLSPVYVNGARGRGKRIFLHADEVAALAVSEDAARSLVAKRELNRKGVMSSSPTPRRPNKKPLSANVEDLAARVTGGHILDSHPWVGLGVVITDEPPKRSNKPSSHLDTRYVVTPHVKTLSWVFRSLSRSFSRVLDDFSKHKFFTRLAGAANRRINASPKTPPTDKELLLAVVDEARLFAREYEGNGSTEHDTP